MNIILELKNMAKLFIHRNIISLLNEISLKIRGKGNQNILNDKFQPKPSEIYLENNKIESNDNKYDFPNELNYIKLVWNQPISDCSNMFKDCKNILEIDLSNFDSSSVIDMKYMFDNCQSLTSINFKNFKTSKVNALSCLFRNCKSLISLDLSGFETINNEGTNQMFLGCKSLTSLNLSNFDTSKVSYFFKSMFEDCSNLVYINMEKAVINNPDNLVDFFKNVPETLVYCINDQNLKNKISSKKCAISDCSQNWLQKVKKIIVGDSNSCVNKCGEGEGSNYPFEYFNKCYKECPNGNYIENGVKKCKCELKQCLNCSHSSILFNQCLYCNEGYFQKNNDINNVSPFINCYNLTEEFYLDKDKF